MPPDERASVTQQLGDWARASLGALFGRYGVQSAVLDLALDAAGRVIACAASSTGGASFEAELCAAVRQQALVAVHLGGAVQVPLQVAPVRPPDFDQTHMCEMAPQPNDPRFK